MDKVIETKSQMIMRIADLSEALQRLQAEYDDLHLNYAGCKTANTGLQELNQKLQAENERLKAQYNCYACDSCSGKEDYINMKRHTENAIKTVHKYRQALQEIRDIVSEQCQQCFVIDGFTKPDDCGTCDYKRIIAKINEVIGEE